MARKLDAFAVAVGLEYYEDYLTVGDLVVITPNRMKMKMGNNMVLSESKKSIMTVRLKY